MIQLVILALSFVMMIRSLISFAGKMQLKKDKALTGGAAILVGVGLSLSAAFAAGFALFILPTM